MEELVSEDLRWLRSLLGVVAEHPLHEPDCLWTGPGYYSLQVYLLVLRHREQFSISKSSRIWPVVNIRLAQDH